MTSFNISARSFRELDSASLGWEKVPSGQHLRLTVLIAAHNEEQSIGATLDSVLAQDRQANRIMIAADNCTDDTVEIAMLRSVPGCSPIFLYETLDNSHKKSGALNQAWTLTHRRTDLFVCIDADTVLPPNALREWEAEFVRDDKIAGCSAKFTMLSAQEMARLADDGLVPPSAGTFPSLTFPQRMWCRLQKAEFAKWTDTALARQGRWTSVLAGTACAIRA